LAFWRRPDFWHLYLAAGNFLILLKKPFLRQPADQSLAQQTALDLHTKDTDGDGLNDWDEENVYHTSQYIADSDSDGIDDGVEIQNSTDPNCPEGQDCNQQAPTEGSSDETVLNLDTTAPSMDWQNSLIDGSGNVKTDISAQEIKELLKQNGFSDEALAKLSDEALLQIYKEAVSTVTSNNKMRSKWQKIFLTLILTAFFSSSFLVWTAKPAQAQWVVTDPSLTALNLQDKIQKLLALLLCRPAH